MNPDEYRKQLEDQLAAQPDPKLPEPPSVSALIAVLKDAGETAESRVSALNHLKLLQFSTPEVSERNAEIVDALRAAVKSGASELNSAALRELAIRQDSFAREMLIEGLEQPSTAIVPPARALQLLAYDDHNNAAPLVRKLVTETKDPDVVVQGLRLLAGDPQSEEVFAHFLTDRTQSLEIREFSAVGLNALNPTRFTKLGRAIVEDETEDNALRAGALGPLTYDTEHKGIRNNKAFERKMGKLALNVGSSLMIAAGRFLLRSRRERSE